MFESIPDIYIEDDAEMQTVVGASPAPPTNGTPIINRNAPRHRAITVKRPEVVSWRYWRHLLGLYRALRAADVERDKARREVATEVEVLAWAAEGAEKRRRDKERQQEARI